MKCDKCRCEGRRQSVVKKGSETTTTYICANPRCANYKQIFAEQTVSNAQTSAQK